MVRCNQQVLDKVGIAAVAADSAFAAPALPAVFSKRRTLDIAFARNSDHNILILNEIL